MDEAVQKGIVQPGRYLTLHFDFSCVTRSRDLNLVAMSLQRDINRELWGFKEYYAEALGESFKSDTSNFIKNDPAGNLAALIDAANFALEGIRHKGEKDNPLLDVRGVCLLRTVTHYNEC